VRETINNILIILLGVLLVVFSRSIAREMIRQNNQFLRFISIRTNYGEREEKVGAWMVIFPSGIFFVVIGILGLLGVG